MQSNKSYHVKLENTSTQKYMPKKYLEWVKIPIQRDNKGNTAMESTITAWIPDTPHANYPPNIALVFNIAGSKARMYFETVDDLMNWVNEFAQFAESNADQMKQSLEKATEQWHQVQQVIQQITDERQGHGNQADEGDS